MRGRASEPSPSIAPRAYRGSVAYPAPSGAGSRASMRREETERY